MIGTTLKSRYRIESELGRGGMGEVYRATDIQSGEIVAVKALNAEVLAHEPDLLARFIREGEALRLLNHPNIVRMIAAVEEDGKHYLAMEFVEGGSLRDLLNTRGKLPAGEVIKLALEVADALTRAHHLGIIHRDLKPANVLIAKDGTPRLADFGIAHMDSDQHLTQTGMLIGTVDYLSPEVCEGERPDERSDIWAFGVMLFEMLSGRLPFEGSNITQRLTAILTQPVPDLTQLAPDVSLTFVNLINRMLEKDPTQRIPSVRLVGAELEAILKGREPITPTRSVPFVSIPPQRRDNLPANLSKFIGREKEVAQIKQRLEKNHLVTLTGSGGIGKTRLSIQTASELLGEYPIGVWLVELAPLTDPSLVPQTVCAALGVKPEGGTPEIEALINYMREKKILLVVDNCEHLIDACAQLCDTLLHACPQLRIIASSREALGIEGENAYRVPSLSLPDPKSGLHVIEESEAVKLFMERAAAVLPEFQMTEANAAVIAQICQRLDGIALAIELAASRVKMLKVEQIASRLDDAFRLLTGGSRTALPRQQTLRALIDWSYNLLPNEERTFLLRLSVFMGGWTLEAAEAVCGNADALDLLTRLADKSLVSVDLEHGDEPRYYLLETVRQYAREKLMETDEVVQLRDAHLAYFLKTAERIAPELYTRKMPYWFDYLESEYANFQSALEWAQEHDVDAGLRLSNSLYPLWNAHGEYRKEGIGWFEIFLKANSIKRNKNRAWGLLYFYNLLTSQPGSPTVEASKYLDESLLLARELGDHHYLSRVLSVYGREEIFSGKHNTAQTLLDESLSEAHLAEDDRLIGIAISSLGQLARYKSDAKLAHVLFEDSLVYLRKTGDLQWLSVSLNHLGNLSMDLGNWNAARMDFEEALSLSKESRDRSSISWSLWSLGSLALGIGEFDQAFSWLNQARQLIQDTPDDDLLSGILLDLGEVNRFKGNFDQAVALYNRALILPHWEEEKSIRYGYLANLERLRAQITESKQHFINFIKTDSNWNSFALNIIPFIAYFAIDLHLLRRAACLMGWVEGQNKTKGRVQQPVYQAEFDRYLDQVRNELPEAEFNAAWAEGQSMSQEQVLALAMEVLQ